VTLLQNLSITLKNKIKEWSILNLLNETKDLPLVDFEPLKQNTRFIPTHMNMIVLICVATVLGGRNVLKDRNGGPVQLWGSTCLDSMKMCTKFHRNQKRQSGVITEQTNK
jgi:hypothetical protein